MAICQENRISQSTSHTLAEQAEKPLRSGIMARRMRKLFGNATARRRTIRYSLVAGNVVVLGAIIFFVFQGSHNASQSPISNAVATNTAKSADPLDQLSSADIAVSVARMTSLPEAGEVANQAISANTVMTLSSADSTVVAKPQEVLTALKSRKDIRVYSTVAGDTIESIAQKFNVTSNSIRWSNGISGNTVAAGTKLNIPPVTGIVYTVLAGETPDSLATKFKADKTQIIAYNDAEISGLHAGEQIIIPNGQQVSTSPFGSSGGYSLGYLGSSATYGSNGYEPGWCTWYAAKRRAQLGIPVPTNLGDAFTWASRSASFGNPTGSAPRQYAVAVKHSDRPGHVAIVEVVNADGSFWISEMNSYGQKSMTDSTPTGGFGVVDYKLIPASGASGYTFVY